MKINRYQALLSTLLLGAFSLACSTNTVTLAYRPAVAPAAQSALPTTQVSVGDFTDNRKEPVHWIGAIRGGYGNPLKVLETDKTVSELIRDAFRQALSARGLYSQTAPLTLSGWIDRLDGDQVARKEATVQLRVVLMELQTRREILNRPVSANKVEGAVMTVRAGIFGSVDELRSLIERVVSQAVDEFIDSSAFQDAVQGSPQARQATGQSLQQLIRVGMPLIDLTAVAPRPLSAVDKRDASGIVVGKVFTYESGGQTVVVTVENSIVTGIAVK